MNQLNIIGKIQGATDKSTWRKLLILGCYNGITRILTKTHLDGLGYSVIISNYSNASHYIIVC